jgi:hypothetical protein
LYLSAFLSQLEQIRKEDITKKQMSMTAFQNLSTIVEYLAIKGPNSSGVFFLCLRNLTRRNGPRSMAPRKSGANVYAINLEL